MVEGVKPAPARVSLSLPFWERGRRRLADALGVELTHSQQRYARVLQRYVTPGCSWLEVGCGRQILPEWALPLATQKKMVARAQRLVGIDVDAALYEHPLLTMMVKALGDKMPFRPGSFDLVTANMVVEHVEHPPEFLKQVHALLRPGGRFLFHTPNSLYYLVRIASLVPDGIKRKIVWILEKRKAEDVFPTYYRMNTREAIERVAHETGFCVEEMTVAGSIGSFSNLGPVGWAELLAMKASASVRGGRYTSNIICVLRRPEH